MLNIKFHQCQFFLEAHLKNYSSAGASDVKELAGETLRHASSQPEGTRYKVRMPLFSLYSAPYLNLESFNKITIVCVLCS